jgi:hypothetical protein
MRGLTVRGRTRDDPLLPTGGSAGFGVVLDEDLVSVALARRKLEVGPSSSRVLDRPVVDKLPKPFSFVPCLELESRTCFPVSSAAVSPIRHVLGEIGHVFADVDGDPIDLDKPRCHRTVADRECMVGVAAAR